MVLVPIVNYHIWFEFPWENCYKAVVLNCAKQLAYAPNLAQLMLNEIRGSKISARKAIIRNERELEITYSHYDLSSCKYVKDSPVS